MILTILLYLLAGVLTTRIFIWARPECNRPTSYEALFTIFFWPLFAFCGLLWLAGMGLAFIAGADDS